MIFVQQLNESVSTFISGLRRFIEQMWRLVRGNAPGLAHLWNLQFPPSMMIVSGTRPDFPEGSRIGTSSGESRPRCPAPTAATKIFKFTKQS